MLTILYKTTNTVTGHFYLGITSRTDRRYKGSGLRLHEQFRQYGRHNFTRQTLAIFASKADAHPVEAAYVRLFVNDPLCLNCDLGGKPRQRRQPSTINPDTDYQPHTNDKATQRAHHLTTMRSPEVRARISANTKAGMAKRKANQ